MKSLVDFTVETYGRVDVLVNSAGVQRYGTVTETEEDVWDEVLSVNLSVLDLERPKEFPRDIEL